MRETFFPGTETKRSFPLVSTPEIGLPSTKSSRTAIGRTTISCIAEFIYGNLPFANHVAFMALEPIGFAARNIDELWIDPMEYGAQLSAAMRILSARGIRVSVYTHQLCVVPSEIHRYCRQSISDWKRVYLPCCEDCVSKPGCGGFFESALPRYHKHSQPTDARHM